MRCLGEVRRDIAGDSRGHLFSRKTPGDPLLRHPSVLQPLATTRASSARANPPTTTRPSSLLSIRRSPCTTRSRSYGRGWMLWSGARPPIYSRWRLISWLKDNHDRTTASLESLARGVTP